MSDYSVALSGVLAARRALDTISQNIANASTPGYARREVQLSARPGSMAGGLDVGSGVSANTITRVRDMFLEGRLQGYRGSVARADIQTRYFSEIEGFLQEPSDTGIASALDQFFSQWQQVAQNPEDATGRTMLTMTAQTLAQRIQSLRQNLVNLRSAVQLEIRDSVDQVNALTRQLAANNQLIDQFAGKGAPLTVMDERDRLMDQLAELVGATNASPTDGRARVTVGSMLLVDGSTSVDLVAPVDVNSPVTVQGSNGQVALDAPNGKLAGLQEMNRAILPDVIAKLDRLAAGIIESVNRIHAEGINAEGRFTRVLSSQRVQDVNGDGNASNDLLAVAGLPFTPTAGDLTLHVADSAGNISTHTIHIDPAHQSLADLVASLNAIGHLSAVDANGRLQITAASGYSFDFSASQGTNLLACLGINSFFDGTDASNIALASALVDHPERVAAGRSADSGDGSNAAAIGSLRESVAPGAGKSTISEMWQQFVTDVGLRSATTQRSADAMQGMVDLLSDQEQSISGVSLDEEAAKMMQFQQLYGANARYMATVSKLMDTLLQYL